MEKPNYVVEYVNRELWSEYWKKIESSNLMQSWEYGDAKSAAEGWLPCRLVIKDGEGSPVALAQVLIKKVGVFFKAARLNRGPLLLRNGLPDSGDGDVISLEVLKALKMESKLRKWIYFSVAPEIPFSPEMQDAVIKIGFRSRAIPSAGSSFLQLACDEKFLMSSLHGKWRNMLRKSQKSNIVISQFEGEAIPISLVENVYKKLKAEKGFNGISDSILHQILTNKSFGNNVKVLVCSVSEITLKDSDPAGVLISVHHGSTATYLIGYTNQVGRILNANYLMLWHAVLNAKKSGLNYYDLGGLNSNTPEGIRRFKKGLNGEEYSLIGEFRSIFFFM